jgi:hypothetical protein
MPSLHIASRIVIYKNDLSEVYEQLGRYHPEVPISTVIARTSWLVDDQVMFVNSPVMSAMTWSLYGINANC